MGVLYLIVIGGLAGWAASYIMKEQNDWLKNICLGIVGAFLGGFIVSFLGGERPTGFNVWNFLVATAGAVLLIYILRKLDSGRKPAPAPVKRAPKTVKRSTAKAKKAKK